jgi:orotidine-5'-phosphate decarboxylase
VALDLESARDAAALVERVGAAACWWKVGSVLFTREGPPFVRDLLAEGARVFLDLKFHDIPNTVAGAVAAAAELGVHLVTVHARGGEPMLRAARDAAPDLPLIAIVRLTSEESDAWATLEEARRIDALGIDGIVASADELPALRGSLRNDFWVVTPGVRPAAAVGGRAPGAGVSERAAAAGDDQRRVSTPGDAARAGSSLIVVGRPIYRAADPAAAARAVAAEIATARPGGEPA